jgi:type II secretory pathway predicted ATPase ExeA
MAGEFVVLLWGLFDNELYAEFGGERFGPYYPVSGPIPLHRYRAFKRGKVDERSNRIRSLADQLGLPIAALAGNDVRLTPSTVSMELPRLPFNAEAHEYHFPSAITAKLAIADELALPLSKLSTEDQAFIHQALSETLTRRLSWSASRPTSAIKEQETNMRVEVMQHYGLTLPLSQAGYFETAHHQQLIKDIKGAVFEGRLIALCGVIGSGKNRDTTPPSTGDGGGKENHRLLVLRHREAQRQAGHLHRCALLRFVHRKQVRIPTQGEKRERDFRELIRKNKRPVALFVDEAHDLNGHTLTGLKRLMELVEDGDGRLSVVLAGHPKLRNDLRRPTMEEIGYRTDIFSLDGITGSQREHIHWLLETCTAGEGRA